MNRLHKRSQAIWQQIDIKQDLSDVTIMICIRAKPDEIRLYAKSADERRVYITDFMEANGDNRRTQQYIAHFDLKRLLQEPALMEMLDYPSDVGGQFSAEQIDQNSNSPIPYGRLNFEVELVMSAGRASTQRLLAQNGSNISNTTSNENDVYVRRLLGKFVSTNLTNLQAITHM